MTEQLIHEDLSVRITSKRVILGKITHMVAHINTIRVTSNDSIRTTGCILGGVGLLLAVIGFLGGQILMGVVGLVPLGIGVTMFFNGVSHTVSLTMGSGERAALEHPNLAYAMRISAALGEAITYSETPSPGA